MHSFPKALAKRTRKSTELNASFRLAFNLRFVWLPTCVALRWNYDDLRWLWSNSNSYASRRKIFTFWPPNAIRRKSTQVDRKLMQVNSIGVKFMTFCDLRELASRLANPFGHPSQVRTQDLVLQTCVDLHRLVNPSDQSLRSLSSEKLGLLRFLSDLRVSPWKRLLVQMEAFEWRIKAEARAGIGASRIVQQRFNEGCKL